MRKQISIALVLIASILAVGFSKISDTESEYQPITNEDKAEAALTDFDLDYSDYKSWYHVTKGNPNTGDPTGLLDKRHKGLKAYREIYMNKVGEAVNKGTAPYQYPTGTMIVKEEYKDKAAWEAGKKPAIKLMVKLEAGTSPESGDWGYATKLNAKKIASGKSKKAKFCSGCHIFSGADYVFINADFQKTE